jgi:hypothetical protein
MRGYIKDSGLTYNFTLDKGKFSFLTGAQKKRFDLLFFMGFDFTRRIYRPEFRPGLSWVIQKPMSYVQGVQVLLLGNLKNKILAFVQNIDITSMGIGKSRVEKSYYITVEYTGIEDTNKDVQQLVTVI